MATPVPTKIGKYDVVGVIGRGGMGIVYQGRDPQLDRLVAIKMITGAFAEHPDMLKRFFREAQSLGSLQHPNIVTVFDLGDYNGNPYLVMEFLEGEGLDSVLSSRRPLSLLEKLTIVIQVCHGLHYAHRRGVIHRDIKPANIMLRKDGGIKIFDFGIAHAGNQNVTRTGQVIGTLRYMAPEQFNSKSADSRTDIFSTGVVFFQLLTNHLPFESENTTTTMMKIVHQPPPPLRDFLVDYHPELEQILQRALAKNPDYRYSSADEFAMDLEQLQGQLKEELIGRELREVAVFLDQGEIQKAQSSLVRVLKVDQQNSTANRLLREVQQRIQREEIGKQVRELRQRTEDALADEQFERALEHVDRALGLDRSNADLQQLRDRIHAATERAEKLHTALKMAEAAQVEGRLDEAREAAEAALAVAPNDTQARTLYRLISREIEERSRQRLLEGYLAEARQEISFRRFTAALEILKRAEELDPAAPQVHSLLESAVAGQDQERCRRELEVLTREVEDALNGDDYRRARQKADEGLARAPDDRHLHKLKALADRQCQVEERRRFVDEQLAAARELLQAGRIAELKEKLEQAISQVGAEPRLQSLLAAVDEKLQREPREMEPSLLQPAPPMLIEPADLSATQIFLQGTSPAHPEAVGRTEHPALPPGARSGSQQPPPLPAPVPSLQSAPGQSAPPAILHGTRSGGAREATACDNATFRTPSLQGGDLYPVQPGVGSDELQAASLPIIERQLAAFIGPLAKILVKRAVGKTTSTLELYTLLAASLEREDDRKAFLASRPQPAQGKTSTGSFKLAQVQTVPPPATLSDASSPSEITPAAIEQATRRLAEHLGPIASVLARKDARRAASLRNFYLLLAEHVADPTERARFLTEAGVQ